METSNSLTIAATGLSALSIVELRSLPDRLEDRQFAAVREFANSGVPALAACEDDHFAKCFRALAILPRQASDDMKGELQVRLYQRKLGHMPKEQINFLIDQALERCRWFPTIAECMEIAAEWERSDDAVQARQEAKKRAHQETMARSEDCTAARRRMEHGGMEQAEIDALPPWVVAYLLKVRELVRCDDCGSLAPARRSRPEPIIADAELEEIIARVEASLSPNAPASARPTGE